MMDEKSHNEAFFLALSSRMDNSHTMLSDEVQLGYALESFGYAHEMGVGWATSTLLHLKNAGIDSMSDLATGCKDNTVNLDLELFGTPEEYHLSDEAITYLKSFLPGPRGFRCFRLAQRIAQRVERGSAETEYVHRLESGKRGDEEFSVPIDDKWVVNVDCAGFVRNSLKHVTKNPFVMSLSDRDFMRAKDFCEFFASIPFTVLDPVEIPDRAHLMKWRLVEDLRMVIPGDIIAYRPRGNAAGGAVFSSSDRKDLTRMLRAVKTAQVWTQLRKSGSLITFNVAKDAQARAWVAKNKEKLKGIGITSIKQFHENMGTINANLKAKGHVPYKSDTLTLMKECCETTASNTGHILFAAGPALRKHNSKGKGKEYRIRVVHSTKHGKLDKDGHVTTGVQEYFKRFTLKINEGGKPYWTREMLGFEENPLLAKPENESNGEPAENLDDDADDNDDDIPNPNDDFEQGEESNDDNQNSRKVVYDDLAGQSDVEVIAARMCF